MLDFLNTLFRSLSPLWEMSVTAAYAAAVVIVLRLLLKKRAPKQVLCLLWLVVFARLLIPVSPESPLSIVPNALPGQEYVADHTPAGPGAGNPAASIVPQNPTPNQPQNQPGNNTVTPVISNQNPSLSVPEGVSPAAPAPEASASFPWQAVIAGVWLTGAAALGGRALASWLRLRRRLFDAIRAKDGAWEHPAVDSPFILGVLRPRIYLPAGLTGQPRQFILCHERAHLRRFDHIVKPMCWIALALHWFNPLVWAAFLLMSRDIESACDEAVVRQLGSGVKADYSETLLALATGRRLPVPCPLAFDEGDARGRIRNVLNYRRPALWAIVVSVIAAALAAVCLLTDPVAAQEPEGNPDPDPDVSNSQDVEGQNSLLDPWMKEVLDGERTFISAYTDRVCGINDLRSFYYGDDQYLSTVIVLDRLAIVDLDRDGLNELVVSPAVVAPDYYDPEIVYSVGYLILRRQGDEVYGYATSYRAFSRIKADGTFYWSSGAANWGTASARFSDDGFEADSITWCQPTDTGDELYFVNGRKATREEFEAAISAQNAKPEPTWYIYKDGALSAKSPIPANADDFDFPVPDFLNEEQRALYGQAMDLYSRLFGASGETVDPNGYGTVEWVEYNGTYYYPDTGAYNSWDDFERTVLSVFTTNFWNTRNKDDTYVNINGIMHYRDWGRGSGGYNENFPETFRLVEQTEDTVSFLMTGYYSDGQGIANEQLEVWLAEGWEYSIEFPMRMVKTADGWRFDEFYNALSDNGIYPFYTQQIPNPDAPPRPSADPYAIYDAAPLDAPIADWGTILDNPGQWYKVAELPDDMIWMFSRDYGAETLLRWDGNFFQIFGHTAHTSYGIMPQLKKLGGADTYGPLAVISNADKGTGAYIEELVVYDLDAVPAAIDYTHDWRPLMYDFNENVSCQYDKDTHALTYTYQGRTVETVLDTDDGFRLRMEQKGISLGIGDFVYYRFDEANDGDIIIELTVELYIGDDVVPMIYPGWVSWTLRFNGSGFDTVPGSCQLHVYGE